MKRCSKCKQMKSLNDYGADKRNKDGKQSKCKRCYADYQVERRKDPVLKAADAAASKLWAAEHPERVRNLHNTARRKRRQDPAYRGRERAENRAIYARVYKDDPKYQAGNRERALAWYRENSDSDRYRLSRRQRENARRARKRAAEVTGPVPLEVYEAVLASGSCVYCSQLADTIDHVTPLARGGHEAEYNLVPCCGPCNSRKGAKLLSEWDQGRVAHGLAHSVKVAEQFALQAAA